MEQVIWTKKATQCPKLLRNPGKFVHKVVDCKQPLLINGIYDAWKRLFSASLSEVDATDVQMMLVVLATRQYFGITFEGPMYLSQKTSWIRYFILISKLQPQYNIRQG